VDTVKVCAPDGAARQVEVGGARYASRDGVYNMRPDHARMLRAAGGFVPNLAAGTVRGGYRCECGFGSHFKRCGRCGRECAKEQ
jgi:hypothetical protein